VRQARQQRGEIAGLADEAPGLSTAGAKSLAVAAMESAVGVAGLAAARALRQAHRGAQPLRRAAGERRAASA
jgi:hypothetical protein